MKKIVLSLIAISVIALPVLALAQYTPPNPTGITPSTDLNSLATNILNKLWVAFTAIAIILFVYAGIKFMTAQGEPDKVQTARSFFLWGVVGVVVAILAYSIIRLAGSLIS